MLCFVIIDTLMIFINILMLYSVFIYIKTNTTKHTLITFVYILMLYFVIIDTLMIFINILMLYLVLIHIKTMNTKLF